MNMNANMHKMKMDATMHNRINGKKRRHNGTKRLRYTALLMAALLSMTFGPAAYAAPPYDHIPESCSEETWNRMQDDLIEWDEIGDLVQYYNPTYTSAFDTAQGSVIDLEGSYSSFLRDMYDVMDETDETVDELMENQKLLQGLDPDTTVNVVDGKPVTAAESLAQLEKGIQAAKAGRKEVAAGIRTASRSVKNASKTVERQLMPVKKAMTNALEGVFIGYEQLSIQREMVEKQVSLYETMYAMQQNLQQNGMATAYDVSAAKNDLEQAKKSLQDVDTGMETIRRSLGLQLGWDGNTLPEIGTLPEPDVAFVDTTNPDADKSAAIMHNSEVKATWKPDYSSSYGFELRDREENEVTGRLVAKMDSLYADMKQKKALYETAKTTLEKARLTRESAERRYELGMLGRSEYEAQQLSYLNYEASYRLAELNLFQSINTYKWAVDGVVTID